MSHAVATTVSAQASGARMRSLMPQGRKRSKRRSTAGGAWSNRWWGIVGVEIQRAIAESLLCENGADLLSGGHDSMEAGLADVLSEF